MMGVGCVGVRHTNIPRNRERHWGRGQRKVNGDAQPRQNVETKSVQGPAEEPRKGPVCESWLRGGTMCSRCRTLMWSWLRS